MKKIYNLIFILTSAFLQAQIVNIPDVNFKNALIERGVDTNGDGEIQVSEAEVVTLLSVGFRNISSLEGIQSFVNLEELNCANNQLMELNLSQNIHLKRLRCRDNQLTDLNVTQCYNLDLLYCANNLLASLDISQNINLENLWASENPFIELDVTNNTNIRFLFCSPSQLTELDVSQNLDLELLLIRASPLESLDLAANFQLSMLDVSRTALTSLDLTSNINLEIFNGEDNVLEVLKINNGNNQNITTMNTEGNPHLRCIEVDDQNAIYPECSEDWIPVYGWCIDPWTFYSEDCEMGVEGLTLPGFTLYPNPVSGVLTISGLGITYFTGEIFSVEGKSVLEFNNQETLNVSKLSNGIYFLNIKDGGGSAHVKKFIKN